MALINKQPGKLTRVHIDKLSDVTDTAPAIVYQIVDSLDGNDYSYIEEKMATRYATHVDKRLDETTGTTTSWLVRDNEAKRTAIANSLFEIIGMHTFNHIVRESMIIPLGAEYEYTPENASFEEDLMDARELANRDLSMARVDELSVAVGSSCVLVQVLGSQLNYQAIPRDKIWVAFAEEITDGDEPRPVNKMNLEEATAIVIQLSDSAGDLSGKNHYVAYFGRSDKYPNGRQVKYWSTQWDDVPDPGDFETGDAEDYYMGDEVANPMTVWNASYSGDEVTPEYPIAVWSGTSSGYGKDLLPISDGLYKQTLELDLGASRVLMSALKSARGVFAFSRDMDSSNVLPDSLDEGPVVLEYGQTLATHSIPGINIKEAMAVLERMAAITAESRQVPAYRIGINVSSIPSGAALRELNRPWIRLINSRIQLNRSGMNRIYDIERILASMENGSPVGSGIEETWIPIEIEFEKDRMDVLLEKEKELQMGVTHVERVAQDVFPHLNSEEAVNNWFEEIREKQPAPQPAGNRAIDRIRARRQGIQEQPA